jgi:hypothetical protein
VTAIDLGVITAPTHSVPIVDPLPADGQFVDANGNPLPFITPDGPFSTTTTDPIVADKTVRITPAAVGIQIGDWIVLSNGPQTDDPREVIAASSSGITVATPFGISATGTTTVTKSKITPVAAWVLGGKPFGNLAWDSVRKQVTGSITFDASVVPAKGLVTIEIHVGTNAVAVKHQSISPAAGATCKKTLAGNTDTVTFALAGPLQGKDVFVRAYLFLAYTKACGVRPGTLQLGPRKGPVFHVPS